MKFHWKKGKPSTRGISSITPSVPKVLSDSSGSHQMALNQPFGIKEKEESLSPVSIEYHLTVQITNSSLSRREISLLLDVLNYQAVYYGVNFNMYLAMFELYFRLLGNKRQSTEIIEPHIRLTVTVSELILKILRDCDFSLYSKNIILLPEKYKVLLGVGLMTKRTYSSRYRTYRPEKFLSVRTVPVDIQFLTRRKDSVPYSSYCKGYGESHPSAHFKKLRISSETDGSGEDPTLVEEQKLFNRCTDPVHLLSELLLIKFSNVEEK